MTLPPERKTPFPQVQLLDAPATLMRSHDVVALILRYGDIQ